MNKRDLLALNLSGTHCHKTVTRPPSCQLLENRLCITQDTFTIFYDLVVRQLFFQVALTWPRLGLNLGPPVNNLSVYHIIYMHDLFIKLIFFTGNMHWSLYLATLVTSTCPSWQRRSRCSTRTRCRGRRRRKKSNGWRPKRPRKTSRTSSWTTTGLLRLWSTTGWFDTRLVTT